jgi:hypothetical protein
MFDNSPAIDRRELDVNARCSPFGTNEEERVRFPGDKSPGYCHDPPPGPLKSGKGSSEVRDPQKNFQSVTDL